MMDRASVFLTLWGFLAYLHPAAGLSPFFSDATAQDVEIGKPRVTATEPAALVSGSKVTFKVRGFELKGAKEIRLIRHSDASLNEANAGPISFAVTATNDAGQAKGLDSKYVGDTQCVADLLLPDDLPAGLYDYLIDTPNGEAKGKIRVLGADAVVDEEELNNGFDDAQEILLGKLTRGSIQSDKDVDVFALSVVAGQHLRISVTSGGTLLMDAQLDCYDSRRQFLAASDDDQSRDPVATCTTSVDGIVYICVSSAHDIGGEWHSYLLAVEEVK